MFIPKDYYQEIADKEGANFQKNKATYPEHYLLLQDLEKAYRLLLNRAVDIRKTTPEEARYFDCMKVSLNLPHQLALAILSLYREHV